MTDLTQKDLARKIKDTEKTVAALKKQRDGIDKEIIKWNDKIIAWSVK